MHGYVFVELFVRKCYNQKEICGDLEEQETLYTMNGFHKIDTTI